MLFETGSSSGSGPFRFGFFQVLAVLFSHFLGFGSLTFLIKPMPNEFRLFGQVFGFGLCHLYPKYWQYFGLKSHHDGSRICKPYRLRPIWKPICHRYPLPEEKYQSSSLIDNDRSLDLLKQFSEKQAEQWWAENTQSESI